MLNNHYTHICLGLDWPDGIRLDKCLAELYPRFSRSEWQEAIAVGGVFIDGAVCEKSAHRTSGGRELMMDFSALPQPASDCSAEDIALNIVYEDADIIVLNKPSGLVVHPGVETCGGLCKRRCCIITRPPLKWCAPVLCTDWTKTPAAFGGG